MSDLMPKEFYEAFRKHFGFGQLTASASSDAYQMLKAAEWAWQASRECLVIELPADAKFSRDGLDENFLAGDIRDQIVESIHAAGVQTK